MPPPEKTDYSVVRNGEYNRTKVGNIERHNERKNENYENADILLNRSHLNHYFKKPTGGYLEMFDQMCSENIISTKGLKKDATIMDEFLFDVNTEYFEERGGYDFALEFFEKTYQYAVEKVGGEQYILSAVLHADERNQEVSERLGKDVFHYHLHVMYVPVVEKVNLWSKRCKDVEKRGTVKEVITQVSHSKKWASHNEVDEDGNKQLVKSYSILQDEFFQYMRDSGYKDVERGVKGSTRKNQRASEFKANKEKERADNLEIQNNEIEKELLTNKEDLLSIEKDISQATKNKTKIDDIDTIQAKPNVLTKKVSIPMADFEDLKVAAKQTYAVKKEENKKIGKLTTENTTLLKENTTLRTENSTLRKDKSFLEDLVSKLQTELSGYKSIKNTLNYAKLEKKYNDLKASFDVMKEFLESMNLISQLQKFTDSRRKERENDTR